MPRSADSLFPVKQPEKLRNIQMKILERAMEYFE